MEEPGGLQSMGSRRVGHDWVTSLSLFAFMHWRRKWQPIPVFLPGESQGWGSLVGCRLWGHRVGHDWSDLQQQQQPITSRVQSIFVHYIFPFVSTQCLACCSHSINVYWTYKWMNKWTSNWLSPSLPAIILFQSTQKTQKLHAPNLFCCFAEPSLSDILKWWSNWNKFNVVKCIYDWW